MPGARCLAAIPVSLCRGLMRVKSRRVGGRNVEVSGNTRGRCQAIPISKERLMIREVEGDILLSKAQVIAHGIAPQDHFDSGLALSLRERWPSMVRDYRHAAHAAAPEPGSIWVWSGVDADGGTRCIANLLTQEMQGSGRSAKPAKATLENVGHCLRELAKYVQGENVQSLALPCLATGVGGLDWKDVKPLLVKHLGELGIPVLIYSVYRKGVAADETLG
ncbi:O-acetyl-ADP-ribose deacetylase (regulator of RNase III), contains Macro domain [Pseudomonas panipatensis]|uniref:O-acetyl-ADP-ribose deacetylase (Regulator of RNase III), contains Macro domain n=2 Tax=Pseudomonas panipatensis TaxID=428992 RepID=A0A1G8F8G3_9PSED|nr:O-acetyl-ADP-ribose deacetylase (regulator of RNase III), contains Macro domain [Pseudomonas panipatensis]SMP54985.1 O-acetyl-ADP-ribose deacetylase (regulator of RNase III), contains Macro domain [Pseudomonas panipatensis]